MVAGQTGILEAAGEMSAMGQKQTSANVWMMSALPPKADIVGRPLHVRFVPIADIQASLALLRDSVRSQLSIAETKEWSGKGTPSLRALEPPKPIPAKSGETSEQVTAQP